MINGADDTVAATVAVGSFPGSIAVNPVTNKIYVVNVNDETVSIIDGTNNTVAATIFDAGGPAPNDPDPETVAVNSVTNKIYVSNDGSVTVIDGATNSTTNIAPGIFSGHIAVNPITNKIYIVNQVNNVTVINGTDNSITTVATGTQPIDVAVNQATNKIYIANRNSSNVTVIDGVNNSTTTTVAANSNPIAVAVNPISGKAYVANQSSSNVTVITPAPTNAIPLNTSASTLAGNTTSNSTPTFTLTATSTYSPNAPPPQNIYFQVDTKSETWTKATVTGSTATTITATATTASLQNGVHIIYFFATDGSDATSINPARPFEKNFDNRGFDILAPESSPIIGGINAYLFLVAPAPVTAANVSIGGRVTTAAGRGISRARVSITNADGETRYALTNPFGFYRFADVAVGETYVVSIKQKSYIFAPQVINLTEDLDGLNFTAQP
ncbi:MAG: carboxypeptidase regulatory-like domain-containing protein [Acidobacteriota bacterium]